jgi:hypothetical protein
MGYVGRVDGDTKLETLHHPASLPIFPQRGIPLRDALVPARFFLRFVPQSIPASHTAYFTTSGKCYRYLAPTWLRALGY